MNLGSARASGSERDFTQVAYARLQLNTYIHANTQVRTREDKTTTAHGHALLKTASLSRDRAIRATHGSTTYDRVVNRVHLANRARATRGYCALGHVVFLLAAVIALLVLAGDEIRRAGKYVRLSTSRQLTIGVLHSGVLQD